MRNEAIGTTNGSAVIQPDDDVPANSPGVWTITYTAGPDGIQAGGSVRFEIPYGFTMPQFEFVNDPGYCRVECSQPGVELSLSYEPPVELEPERFFYVTRWGRMVYVEIRGEDLREGEQIDFIYGERTNMAPGAWAQHFAAPVEFTVATDVDGTRSAKFSGYTLVSQQPIVRVVAAEPAELVLYSPSIVQMGETFDVKIVAEDEERNAARDMETHLVVESTDGAVSTNDVKSGEYCSTTTAEFNLPGEKLLTGFDAHYGIGGVSNPVLVTSEKPQQRLFWGDIHGHTRLSDGLGTPEEYYEFGRIQACLDFCATADHSQYISDEDWEHLQETADEHNEPGRFVTLHGYEVSLNADKPHYGDKCVYFPGEDRPLLRATDINRSEYADLSEYTERWKDAGAMMILHQHAGGSESYYDRELVRLAEVYSVWGESESLEGSRPLLPAKKRDFSGMLAGDCLEQGMTLGFVASSDDHAGRPGRTDWLRRRRAYPGGLVAVWTPELTRSSVWDALWNRRCYGTSGARIIVEFYVDGQPMGSIIDDSESFADTHRVQFRVVGTAPIAAVEVMRGRELIYAHSSFNASCQVELMTQPSPGDANYYYLRVLQVDGEMAWSSPVWVS